MSNENENKQERGSSSGAADCSAVINIDDVASNYNEAYLFIQGAKDKLPLWLKIGNGSIQITPENHKGIKLGILLHFSIKDHFEF